MPYKLLIVDDDKEFVEEIVDSLEEYEIVSAYNGADALRILGQPHEIDLVLLDVMMPGAKGTEILRKIKTLDPDMGVIILTGYSTKNVVIEALKGRADDYIEKPIQVPKTKQIIDRLLSRKMNEKYSQGLNGKIERVKNFAERNHRKKVNLKDVANIVNLSPKYLSRIFKQKTGMRFSEYKLQLTMSRAKQLLENTEYNIDQISYETGYENAESFIRIFKKLTGCTPTEYRDRHKH